MLTTHAHHTRPTLSTPVHWPPYDPIRTLHTNTHTCTHAHARTPAPICQHTCASETHICTCTRNCSPIPSPRTHLCTGQHFLTLLKRSCRVLQDALCAHTPCICHRRPALCAVRALLSGQTQVLQPAQRTCALQVWMNEGDQEQPVCSSACTPRAVGAGIALPSTAAASYKHSVLPPLEGLGPLQASRRGVMHAQRHGVRVVRPIRSSAQQHTGVGCTAT